MNEGNIMANNLRKNLMLTSQVVVGKTIQSVLEKFSMKIDTSYDALSSLSVLKDAYKRTGNTVFIRKAFARFVAEHGTPFLLIIDYRIYLTSNLEEDPDMRKILRTFILSYMIINRDIDSPRNANIVLIDVGEKGSGAAEIENNPLILLDILETGNDEINALIQSYRKDIGKFLKLFNIISMSPRDDRVFAASKLDKFINQIQASYGKVPVISESRIEASQAKKLEETNSNVDSECHVLVKIDENSLLIDGKESKPADNEMYSDLKHAVIYIIGYWNKKNQRNVTDIILRIIRENPGQTLFGKTDEIVINLSRDCVIDSLILSSLFTLINHDLADYPKLKILVDFKNGVILENTPGYIIIKDRVYHVY